MQAPSESLKSISELVEKWFEDNEQKLIHPIKDYLNVQLGLRLKVDSGLVEIAEEGCALWGEIPNVEELETKLAKIKSFISYRILKTNSAQYLIIGKIDPAIMKFSELRVEDTVKQALTEQLSKLKLGENTSISTPPPFNPQPAVPAASVLPKPFYAKAEQRALDLSDLNAVFNVLQGDLNSVMIKGKTPVGVYISKHFAKYHSAATMLMYELISRGDLRQLQTFMKTETHGETKKTTTVITNNSIFDKEQKQSVVEKIKHSSYFIKLNFSLLDLVEHMQKKAAHNPNQPFLGLKGCVADCIKFVYDDAQQREELLKQLDEVKAFKTMGNFFGGMRK